MEVVDYDCVIKYSVKAKGQLRQPKASQATLRLGGLILKRNGKEKKISPGWRLRVVVFVLGGAVGGMRDLTDGGLAVTVAGGDNGLDFPGDSSRGCAS